MRLFRREYAKPIPPNATTTTSKDGEIIVRWRGRTGFPESGRPHPTKAGFVLVECRRWTGVYTDEHGKRKYVALFTSRPASEKELIRLRDTAERIRCGDISPGQVARGDKDLGQIIDEWGKAILAKDATKLHSRTSVYRVKRIAGAIKAALPIDFTGDRVQSALKSFRDASPGISAQTSNHYLTCCKSFLTWCVRQRYLESMPITGAEPVECESRRTFTRRALTAEELAKLITSTLVHVVHQSPLSGPDRAAMYLVAAYTGFRVGEIAKLSRESFDLDADPPRITLPGSATKNKREAVQPIPESVADHLRGWLATKANDGPLWPGYRWRTGKVADLVRCDLKAAGIEAETPAGRIDFHALRTTFATMLARSGVPIQHAQKLMRHSSPDLTVKHYTRLGLVDLGEQVAKLPQLAPKLAPDSCESA